MVCKKCQKPIRAKGLCASHYMKELRISNPGRARAIQVASYERLKQRVLKRNYEWRQANKQTVKAAKDAWNESHPEKVLEAKRKWYKANKPKVIAYDAARRAREVRAMTKWANKFFIEEIYDLARRRTELKTGSCGKWEVDHIVPITSRLVCGLHVEHNLQVIPASQNRIKGNRTWPQMP